MFCVQSGNTHDLIDFGLRECCDRWSSHTHRQYHVCACLLGYESGGVPDTLVRFLHLRVTHCERLLDTMTLTHTFQLWVVLT